MIYTSEATHHDGMPIHRALIRKLWDSHTVSGATVLRGIWGFHGDHEPHGDKLIQYGRQVPVTTIVVDTPEVIAACFHIVDEVTGTPRSGHLGDGARAVDARRRRSAAAATDLADYSF